MLANNWQDFTLTGRVAVVSRATRENGPAICESLARQGAKVVVGDSHPHAEARRLATLGYEVMGIEAEVSQVSRLETLLAQTVQRYGRVDINFWC
jgi:NAD(P)-dependent dehydrogenase (short-subunit alcohol dehydrogenase family)